MKRMIALVLSAFLLLPLGGCDAIDDTAGVDMSRTQTEDTGSASPGQGVNFEAKYIRKGGCTASYPAVFVIRSVEALEGYLAQYKAYYHVVGDDDGPAPDSETGLLDAMAKYDAAYFDEQMLVLVLLEEGSGSIRHRVTHVTENDGRLLINIDRLLPEVGTCDMAYWHILIEPEAGIRVAEEQVILSLDGHPTLPKEAEDTEKAEESTASGPISEDRAIAIAKEEINVAYDAIEVSFQEEHNRYLVYFKHKDMVGGYRYVFVSADGEILGVMWDA